MAETLAREADRLLRAMNFHDSDGLQTPCNDFYCDEQCSLKRGTWDAVKDFLHRASEDERIQ